LIGCYVGLVFEGETSTGVLRPGVTTRQRPLNDTSMNITVICPVLLYDVLATPVNS